MLRRTWAIAATLLALSSATSAATSKVEVLDSGITLQRMTVTQGASPKATDVVKVHYRGTLRDGSEFDSSYARRAPASFPLNAVIPCWTIGLQKMRVGEKATLICPPDTAYGSREIPGKIKANSTLNFEVELLAIEK